MAVQDTVVIDLSNYKDRNGAHVPEGIYRVIVEDAETSRSNAGNEMITVWFRIVGGEFDGDTIVDRLTLSEKSMFRVVGFLQAISIKTPKARLRLPVESLKGKSLDIDVSDGEPYMGRVKSEVRSYLRILVKETDKWETPDPLAEEATADSTDEGDVLEAQADAAHEARESAATAAKETDEDDSAEVDLEDIDLR